MDGTWTQHVARTTWPDASPPVSFWEAPPIKPTSDGGGTNFKTPVGILGSEPNPHLAGGFSSFTFTTNNEKRLNFCSTSPQTVVSCHHSQTQTQPTSNLTFLDVVHRFANSEFYLRVTVSPGDKAWCRDAVAMVTSASSQGCRHVCSDANMCYVLNNIVF